MSKQIVWRAKLKAFSIHLLISAVIISSFMLVITQFWFPDALFALENVWEGLRILVPVDAIVGPLLTLIVFAPGKKGLKLDLAIIGALQITALIYGGWAIHGAKPDVIAWAGDRFEVVTSAQFDKQRLPKTVFSTTQLGYPLMVYPLPAQSEEEFSDFVINDVQYQLMAERYRPLIDYREQILERALNIDFIQPEDKNGEIKLEEFRKTFDPDKEALFILQGTLKNFIIIALELETMTISGYLELDPWEVHIPKAISAEQDL